MTFVETARHWISQSSIMSIAYFLPLLLILALAGWTCYAAVLHPLARIPGPFIASVTRIWYVAKVRQGSCHKINQKLHEKYGRTVFSSAGFDEFDLLTVAE